MAEEQLLCSRCHKRPPIPGKKTCSLCRKAGRKREVTYLNKHRDVLKGRWKKRYLQNIASIKKSDHERYLRKRSLKIKIALDRYYRLREEHRCPICGVGQKPERKFNSHCSECTQKIFAWQKKKGACRAQHGQCSKCGKEFMEVDVKPNGKEYFVTCSSCRAHEPHVTICEKEYKLICES